MRASWTPDQHPEVRGGDAEDGPGTRGEERRHREPRRPNVLPSHRERTGDWHRPARPRRERPFTRSCYLRGDRGGGCIPDA